MPLKTLYCAAIFLTFPAIVLADKPLAEVARPMAGKLATGCIVTGEKIGEKVSYSAAGHPEPDGIAPERRVFEIGSITKVFTGVLLAQAVIDKKVRLDSTLQELLGKDFRFSDPQVGRITLLQLSTHTSGLPRLPGNIGPDPDSKADPYADYDRAMMNTYLSSVKLDGPPPHTASYSNFAVGVLGELLADAYGKPWDVLIAEKITGPLGMEDTMAVPGEDQRKRLAPPYQNDKPAHEWNFKSISAAGSLRSTAADLMIFGSAMATPDKFPIAPAIREMMRVHSPGFEGGSETGLGIIISKLDGATEFLHSGGTGGYRSVLQVIPEKRSVRVVLINNNSTPAETVLFAVREEKKPEPKAAVPLTEQELDALTGIYAISPGAKLTVVRRGAVLHIQLTGQAFLPVKSIGGDRFRYEVVAAEIQFHREGGAVKSLTLFQNGRELNATRTAEPLPLPVDLAELEAYAGSYQLFPGQIFTITVKNGSLFAQLTGQPAAPITQTKPGYFEYSMVKAALEFQKDASGKVTGLILHQNGKHPAKKL